MKKTSLFLFMVGFFILTRELSLVYLSWSGNTTFSDLKNTDITSQLLWSIIGLIYAVSYTISRSLFIKYFAVIVGLFSLFSASYANVDAFYDTNKKSLDCVRIENDDIEACLKKIQ